MNNNLKSLIAFMFSSVIGLICCIMSYRFFFKSVYPIWYEDIVNKYSKMYNIEPELIYAVIIGESNFDPNAKSTAGAIGLMQITPATFEWLQMYTKESDMDSECLFDPEVNIRYGVLFMNILRKKYYSDDLMLCAYNAGMSSVERWLSDENVSPNGEELEIIPYKETRNYVKKINKYKIIYKCLYF